MPSHDPRADGAGLAQRVISHFPTVTLSPRGLFGAHGTTWDDYAEFAAGVRGETWSSLELEFVRRHRDAVYFVLGAALPALIPAWLLPVVAGEDEGGELARTLIVALSPHAPGEPSSTERFSALTATQAAVVADVLEWLEARHRETHRRPDWRWVDAHDNPATSALTLYWRRFASHSGE